MYVRAVEEGWNIALSLRGPFVVHNTEKLSSWSLHTICSHRAELLGVRGRTLREEWKIVNVS